MRITFNVVAPLIVKPPGKIYLQAISGRNAEKRLLLHRTDNKPLAVPKLTSGMPDLIKLKVSEASVDDAVPGLKPRPGDLWLDVSMQASGGQLTRATKIRLETNHPDAAVFELPVTVRVRGMIEATPKNVQLWLTGTRTKAQSRGLRLTHNGNEKFTITKVEVSDPEMFTATVKEKEPAKWQTVMVQLAEGVDPEAIKAPVRGTLTVYTSDPKVPIVEVEVSVSKRRSYRPRQSQQPVKVERVKD